MLTLTTCANHFYFVFCNVGHNLLKLILKRVVTHSLKIY